ncbi:hypothetical protein DESPIG_01552 [Desulfovibrio piger ATCC 29098]|uniref:Uncharacterized protein n=1 Tax=Desulfovibrio piger ATCC 29098 TaxID=411464 RepID=B6WTZ4_9BACT|nr:hypothetical protein DESPIG_01552 [Desulfovibrio piger ATCC 29098]
MYADAAREGRRPLYNVMNGQPGCRKTGCRHQTDAGGRCSDRPQV